MVNPNKEPIFVDLEREIASLERTLRDSQSRSDVSIRLMGQTLHRLNPLWTTDRQIVEALGHTFNCLTELKIVTDGLITGLLEMVRTVLAHQIGKQ